MTKEKFYKIYPLNELEVRVQRECLTNIDTVTFSLCNKNHENDYITELVIAPLLDEESDCYEYYQVRFETNKNFIESGYEAMLADFICENKKDFHFLSKVYSPLLEGDEFFPNNSKKFWHERLQDNKAEFRPRKNRYELFSKYNLPNSSTCKNAPKSFKTCFENLNKDKTLIQMGFPKTTSAGEVWRFCIRWRFANSFEGVILKEYTNDTINGYSSLVKVFLAFSVFERYLVMVGKSKWYKSNNIFDTETTNSICELFLKTNKNNTLIDFLIKNADKQLKERLEKIKNYQNIETISENVLALPAAIRHIFAHGHLSASPKKVSVKLMRNLNEKLAKSLLDFMDSEFTKLVESDSKN